MKQQVDPASAVSDTLVTLQGVRFGWGGAAPVLDIGEFRLARRARVFLHGASGSGKTTLLNLIAGMISPQAGSIEVLGTRLDELSGGGRDRFRADHIGFIFQMFNLIPYLGVLENVCLACDFSPHRRARAVAARGSVRAEALHLLGNLDMADPALLGRRVTDLSVGQQQRVAAARALMGSPELVIADEPTSALDADRRSAFIDLLFAECGRAGSALLFVSHDHALAPRFDRSVALGEMNKVVA